MQSPRYNELKNKVALITGSGKRSGIGFSITRLLAENKANLVITDIVTPEQSEKEMGKLALELAEQHGVETMFVPLDVTDDESITTAVKKIEKRFGRLDILVNNAGAAIGAPSEIKNYDVQDWLKTIDVNLHGVFRVSKACTPLITKQQGSIINLSSRAGKVPNLYNGAYHTAKAGVLMLTKVMAMEMASTGVRVNAVCPGVIDTELQEMRIDLESKFQNITYEERKEAILKTIPLGYMADPNEVASVVVFLASNASSYLTGQAINICGGMTMTI